MIRDVKDNNSNLRVLVSNPEPLRIIRSLDFRGVSRQMFDW